MGLCILFFTVFMATLGSSIIINQSTNVMDLGATGDGTTDDSQAFTRAWEAVCSSSSGVGTLSIPAERTFLLKSLVFKGPCKPTRVYVHVEGNIVNESNTTCRDYYMGSWIVFSRVDGLTVDGFGLIDGRGKAWWEACGQAQGCPRPVGLKFDNCNSLRVSWLKLINSPARFISVSDCEDAIFSNLIISNPSDSPNTDAIDVTHSRHVQVLDTQIGVGIYRDSNDTGFTWFGPN